MLVPALGVLVAASHTREQGKSVKNIVSQNPACKILLLVGMIMVLVIYGIWGGVDTRLVRLSMRDSRRKLW